MKRTDEWAMTAEENLWCGYSNSQLTEMLANTLKPTYSFNLFNDINIQDSVDLNKYNLLLKHANLSAQRC